jgi:hypothetical protein
MALTKCKECGNVVSTKAKSCPQCGAVIKEKMGCIGYVGSLFLILFAIGLINSLFNGGSQRSVPKTNSVPQVSAPQVVASKPSKQEEPPEQKIVSIAYKERDTVSIGYTSYVVLRSWWSKKLSENKYIDEAPNATFLFVELTVRNNDKKARTISPFKLIDENGAEYDSSSKAWRVKNAIGMVEELNPSVEKTGIIVFDVPDNHRYRLKVSGGFWSKDYALINLFP